jgi:hypothetical protein
MERLDALARRYQPDLLGAVAWPQSLDALRPDLPDGYLAHLDHPDE